MRVPRAPGRRPGRQHNLRRRAPGERGAGPSAAGHLGAEFPAVRAAISYNNNNNNNNNSQRRGRKPQILLEAGEKVGRGAGPGRFGPPRPAVRRRLPAGGLERPGGRLRLHVWPRQGAGERGGQGGNVWPLPGAEDPGERHGSGIDRQDD